MKRVLNTGLSAIALTVFSLVAIGGGVFTASPALAKADFVIKVTSVLAESNPNCQGLLKFKEYLEEKSGGRIEVQVYPGGVLAGSDEINVELVMTGGTQMAVSPAYCLAQKADTPEFDVTIYPFLTSVPDKRIYYELMNNSEVINEITKRFEAATDVKICGYYDIGWIDIGNKRRPFVDVASGKGLKIRSAVASIWKDTLQAFGPSAVPMSYGEVFAALQQGTIDGVVSSTPCFVSDRFYEELKHLTLSHHVLVIYGIYVNKTFFNSMPKDLQDIYLEACQFLIKTQDALHTAAEETSIETMKQAGLKMYTLNPEERAAWAKNAQAAIDANVKDIGPDFYARVKSEVALIEKDLGLR